MMIRRCQPLLGTFVEISLAGGADESLHQTAGKAFELIRGIQHLMGFHDPESDVSRLNRCAHIAPLRVHPWTYDVISKAIKISEETEGAFDITIAPQLVRWGYLPRHTDTKAMMEAGLWRSIDLLPNSHIRFQRPLQIDLGGIAKGYAVDKAIDWLGTRGISSAAVNAGGDLRLLGPSDTQLAIRDPLHPQRHLHDTPQLRPAVATTAAYFVRKRVGLSKVTPIVNPQTGKPMRNNLSVSVFAHTCVEADALTKAVLIAPQQTWNRVLKDHDSLALFINQRGEQVLFPA